MTKLLGEVWKPRTYEPVFCDILKSNLWYKAFDSGKKEQASDREDSGEALFERKES